MTKIVVNTNLFFYFDLTAEAIYLYAERKNIQCLFYRVDPDTSTLHILRQGGWYRKEYYNYIESLLYVLPFNKYLGEMLNFTKETEQFIIDIHKIPRTDPDLIAVIEELQERAYPIATGTILEILEIPDDVNWHLVEAHGYEFIRENSREWHGKPTEEDNYYNNLLRSD